MQTQTARPHADGEDPNRADEEDPNRADEEGANDDAAPLKLLAVSFSYPPLAYPRSSQVARLLKHANASTVMVCADERGARTDPTIEPDAEARLSATLRLDFAPTLFTRTVSSLLYRLHRPSWRRMNMAPDKYAAWKNAALVAVGDLLERARFAPDAVVTFAQPFTDHLVGLELKRRYRLPWAAHFSDPWTDNPFTAYDERTRRLNLALEKSVIEEADLTIFTSRETVERVFEKYPDELRERARVLPQCFDPALYGARALADGPLIVRYIGNFYGARSPEPLCRALAALHAERPGALMGVRFEVVGAAGDPALIARYGCEGLPEGLLVFRPTVSYSESLRLMGESDGLLVIDAPAEVSLFLPSKLIDYVGAARPILGLTPPGAARDVIERLGGPTADPSDTEAICRAVASFLETLRARREAGALDEWGAPEVRREYEATHVAREFDRILREAVARAGA